MISFSSPDTGFALLTEPGQVLLEAQLRSPPYLRVESLKLYF